MYYNDIVFIIYYNIYVCVCFAGRGIGGSELAMTVRRRHKGEGWQIWLDDDGW